MSARFAAADTVQPHDAIRTLLLTDGELTAITLDERTGAHHMLNTAAAAVWAVLDRPSSVDELIDELASDFGVERSTAASTVDAALESFWDNGMLAGSPEPDETTAADHQAEAAEVPRVLPREPDP